MPQRFLKARNFLSFLIAARRDEFGLIQPIIEQDIPRSILPKGHPRIPRLVEGGATRQNRFLNAARVARGDLIMVHDAARPMVSPQLIRRVIEAALQSGAALAALPCPDTVKQAAENGCVAATLDRSVLWLAQTPADFSTRLVS